MFAKLNKLRSDHDKAMAKLQEAQKKVDELSERVKQAEVDEVVSIANEFKLTPEKLYEMVKGKSETAVIKDVAHNKPFNPVTTVKKDEEEII